MSEYRLLDPSEQVQEGDDYFYEKKWRETFIIGITPAEFGDYPFRRKIWDSFYEWQKLLERYRKAGKLSEIERKRFKELTKKIVGEIK